MTATLKTALIQVNSGNDVDENITKISAMVEQAAEKADFIALPENAFLMAENKQELLQKSPSMNTHPAISKMQQLSKSLKKNVLIGGVAVQSDEAGKLSNRSILLNPDGEICATYNKIHMFDVEIPDGESHKESATYKAGNDLVTSNLPNAVLGFSICYDSRFPQQFRQLAQDGAEIITVPSAFTYKTGKAHWEVLLRARAIETGCFILAPAMCGQNTKTRRTWGHSMIVNPWGEILTQASEANEEIIYAELNLQEVSNARKAIPSLNN